MACFRHFAGPFLSTKVKSAKALVISHLSHACTILPFMDMTDEQIYEHVLKFFLKGFSWYFSHHFFHFFYESDETIFSCFCVPSLPIEQFSSMPHSLVGLLPLQLSPTLFIPNIFLFLLLLVLWWALPFSGHILQWCATQASVFTELWPCKPTYAHSLVHNRTHKYSQTKAIDIQSTEDPFQMQRHRATALGQQLSPPPSFPSLMYHGPCNA
jgi:hypothetical protein